MIQFSHPYMTTGKTVTLTVWTFVSKVMSLFNNMLSRCVITFLPSNKCLNFVAAVTVHSGILEPKKIKSVTVSILSPSICHKVMGLDSMILVFWMLTFKPEVNVFLEFPCFFYDPTYWHVDSLIFCSSAFSKSNSYIWKFLVHVLLKCSLKDFEHYFARMWNERNCAVVWTFFVGITTYNFRFFVLCIFFTWFLIHLHKKWRIIKKDFLLERHSQNEIKN